MVIFYGNRCQLSNSCSTNIFRIDSNILHHLKTTATITLVIICVMSKTRIFLFYIDVYLAIVSVYVKCCECSMEKKEYFCVTIVFVRM